MRARNCLRDLQTGIAATVAGAVIDTLFDRQFKDLTVSRHCVVANQRIAWRPVIATLHQLSDAQQLLAASKNMRLLLIVNASPGTRGGGFAVLEQTLISVISKQSGDCLIANVVCFDLAQSRAIKRLYIVQAMLSNYRHHELYLYTPLAVVCLAPPPAQYCERDGHASDVRNGITVLMPVAVIVVAQPRS